MRNEAVKVGEKGWKFRHNEDGKVTQITMPGQGGESLVAFDETGAVSAWTASAGDKQIAYERYTYDEYGNLTQLDKDGRHSIRTMRWTSWLKSGHWMGKRLRMSMMPVRTEPT